MKMKTTGILFVVLSVCALLVRADEATMDQAASIARAIVARKATMGEKLGSSVESVVKSSDTNAPYYVVKMRGGGTIITSGDTDLEPVVAIISGTEDFKNLPSEHPLRELLRRDLALRQRFLNERKRLPVVSMMSVNAVSSVKKSRGKWEKLLAEDEARNRPRLMSMYGLGGIIDAEGEGAEPIGEPDSYMITDMRVEPLVKATWSQSGNGENLFTPEHSVCGCVATATAQIMHYHQWPTNDCAVFKNSCSYDGTRKEYESMPGVYDWANMPADNRNANAAQEEAIGKLTYNCGVAVGMMWTLRSSGASSLDIPDSYTKFLGYEQALQVVDFYGNLELHTEESFQKYLYPSLDAGYPVQIGIADSQGMNGHSIVGDGYGYLDDGETKIPYVHINMGWGANSGYNAWYNFPNVPYTATVDGEVTEYVIVTTLTYNILPELPQPKDPGRGAYIVSGRVFDEEDNPLKDAEIEIINADGLVVSVVSSSVYGVWGAALGREGPYTIVANLESQNISGEIANLPFRTSENSWGNNIQLTNFSVENVTLGEQYSSLNRAITKASAGDVIEVFTQSVFNATCAINKSLTIRGRAGVDPEFLQVAVGSEVELGVENGGNLAISNLTFTLGTHNLDERSLRADVATNGLLKIENVNGLREITLRDDNSFVFAGEVTNAIYIVSASTNLLCTTDSVFGHYVGEKAKDFANYLLNDADDELGGRANEDGTLVWADVPVPEAAAGAKLKLLDGGEVTTNYRTLAALLRHRSGDAEIEIVQNGISLNEPVEVKNKLTILASGTSRSIKAGSKMNFAIEENGELLVTNVLISAGKGDTLFTITEGGKMTLEADAEIFGLRNDNADIYKGGGAIVVDGGRFTLRPRAIIRDCSTGGNGAAIFALSGEIALEGGQIRNCSSKGAYYGGGAIFAFVPETSILISGEPVVSGNSCNDNPDNLHLEDSSSLTSAPIEIVGAMGLNAQIGLTIKTYCNDNKNYGTEKMGQIFAVATDELAYATPAAKALATHAFVRDADFNVKDPELMAAWNDATGHDTELLWAENTLKGEVTPGTEELATVRTTAEDGKTRLYYKLQDAFQYLPSAGLVELLTNEVEIVGDITIPYDTTITTMAETNEVFALIHDGSSSGSLKVPTGVSLTLTNLNFTCVAQAHQRAIEVRGGSLTLAADTTVFGYAGFDTRASSAIVVWDGGTFTMKDGAIIHSCRNTYVDLTKDVDSGAGGAVLIDGDGAKGYFLGGVISNCYAWAGGGVAVCNKATAYVSGNLFIAENHDQDATNPRAVLSDFVVEDTACLYLDGPLAESAAIGQLAGFRADTNLVAYVEDWASWDFNSLTNSAAKFFSDVNTWVHGFVVTNATDNTALIVWSTSIAEDGSFVLKNSQGRDSVYYAVAPVPTSEPEPGPTPPLPTPPVPEYAEPDPIVFTFIGVNEDRTRWILKFTNAVKWCNYEIYGTNTLDGGFILNEVAPLTNFQWKSTAKEVELTLPASNDVRFWRVKGLRGIIEE